MIKRELIILTIAVLSTLNICAQIKNSSDFRTITEKNKTLHSFNIWQLDQVRGESKAVLTLNAIEYFVFNVPAKSYGVQFDLKLETGSSSDPNNHLLKKHQLYVHENEYSELSIAIKDIIQDYKSRKESEKHGSIHYQTNDELTLGFIYTLDKDLAFIEYKLNDNTYRGEFQYPEKIFEMIYKQIDKAKQKLYLPENAQKLKKAKKAKQETEEIIIDDI